MKFFIYLILAAFSWNLADKASQRDGFEEAVCAVIYRLAAIYCTICCYGILSNG